MLSTLRRFADLTLLEQATLLQFIALSLSMKVALSVMSVSRLVFFLSRTQASLVRKLAVLLPVHAEPQRLFFLTDIATGISHGKRRCLPRSLLLFWLLRAADPSVSVCIGVSKNLADLEGHAWVEQDGVVLGDTVSFIDRYTPILRLPA